jgi:transposase
MAGVFKLDITETVDELKTLLGQQRTAFGKERVQALYLLKQKKAKTIQELAQNLGRDRTTVQRWLRRYRQGGVSELLKPQSRWGRKPGIPQWAERALNKRLQERQGFHSYGEIQEWLERTLGVSVSYQVAFRTVHYKLRGKLKRPRPQSLGHNSIKAEAFKKTCP